MSGQPSLNGAGVPPRFIYSDLIDDEPESLRDHAVAAARRGDLVFQLEVGGKRPAFEGWQARATSDPEKVHAMWSDPITGEPQEWNVGIKTGDTLVVVDVDVKNGARGAETIRDLQTEIGALPSTRRVVTASGGTHACFRVPDGVYVPNSAGRLGPGVDVRGDGGYVVGPGSVIGENEYYVGRDVAEQLLPAAYLARIVGQRPPERSAERILGVLDDEAEIERATAWLERHAPLATEGNGGDDTTYRVACRVIDHGLSPETTLYLMLEHWNSRCSPPWDLEGLQAKIDSAWKNRKLAVGVSTAAGEFEDVSAEQVDAVELVAPAAAAPAPITATPYQWIEPASIPPRDWLYGRHLLRQFASSTIAPGGVGKTGLKIVEALAMVSGRDLLKVGWSREPLRVWLWNLEDPRAEMQRRIQAAALHYGLSPRDLSGLFVDTGREQQCVIAETTRTGAAILRPVVRNLVAEIRTNSIDVAIIDPFVSSHRVTENDNNAVDLVAKEWGRIADEGNCAIDLVHHTRKMAGFEAETTVESSRGGKALTDACRSNIVVNRMTKEEAAKAGVDNHRLYFRTYDDKNNLTPPADRSDWFRLVSVDLHNRGLDVGDNIGVVTPWQWPEPTENVDPQALDQIMERVAEGTWRKDSQASAWIGKPIAEVLGLDVKTDRARLSAMIKTWMTTGVLEEAEGLDEKRKPRTFIRVGSWPAPP